MAAVVPTEREPLLPLLSLYRSGSDERHGDKPDDSEHEDTLLWLGRNEKEAADKKDGVLVIPYAAGQHEEARPVCWFFAMDMSESMNTPLPNQTDTRWDVACRLLQHVLDDLLAASRHEDTLTIIGFNQTPTVICDNLRLHDEWTSRALLTSLPRPRHTTNIQLANSCVHTLMLNNPHLKAGTHRAAEIFFTDGEPTEGLKTLDALQHQKTVLYLDLIARLHMTVPPFLWCGAISDAAQWRVVRGLSQASSMSLWAHIRDGEMSHFAAEIGGVVAMVTHLRVYQLPGLTTLSKRLVMLLPDTDNAYYCREVPPHLPDTLRRVEASAIITLFKIRCCLEEHALRHKSLSRRDLRYCLARATSRRKTDDAFIRTSTKWSMYFERLKTMVMQDMQELLRVWQTTGQADMLSRQVSGLRDTAAQCANVSAAAHDYQILLTRQLTAVSSSAVV